MACGLAIAAFAFGAAISDRGGAPPPSLVSQLPLPRLVGLRLIAGFEGTSVPEQLRRAVRQGGLSGVVLFRQNLPSREAARTLIAELESIPRPAGLRDPLLVMVDQEGGLVKRLAGAPTASAAQMGGAGAARAQGRATAANLSGVGVNVDLAPVLDVARPGGAIASTERGFGASAAAVEETAVPFAVGLQDLGVAATAKHFPGLGAAAENTDFAVQRVDLPKRTLRAVDERPYRRFIAAGGGLVMLSTAIYPAFSPRPAAFARSIATGELRRRLGFHGVSITDALESAAAGTDLLLFTDYRAAMAAGRALRGLLRSAPGSRAAFEASAGRILRLRRAPASNAARRR
jgi:beta-N-acetylhexosaminidase